MSQAAAILAGAQALYAQEFPATVRIGPQTYAAGTGGRRRQAQLEAGGFAEKAAVSFWLPLAAFAAAGQPMPKENEPLTCSAPAELAGDYRIEAVLTSGGVSTVTLRCISLS